MERMAEEEKNLLLTLIDNIPDIFFLKDREGRFRLVNRAFAELIGAAGPEELVGKSDLDVFPRDIAEAYRADDRLLMEGNQRGPRAGREDAVGTGRVAVAAHHQGSPRGE